MKTPAKYAPGAHDRMQAALGGVYVVAALGLVLEPVFRVRPPYALMFAVVLCIAGFGAYGPAAPAPPALTRPEAEDLWGYIPEEWPPWGCPDCGQRNAPWALECGRCEHGRTGNDHD